MSRLCVPIANELNNSQSFAVNRGLIEVIIIVDCLNRTPFALN